MNSICLSMIFRSPRNQLMRVKLNGIHVNRNQNSILSDFNLETQSDEYVVILGQNGAGKTTALRTIAGLQAIDGGEIYFNENSVKDLPPRKRSVSMVFQDDALYPHLKLGAAILNSFPKEISGEQREFHLRSIVNSLGLESLVDRYPNQISGGEARRTAIACAMARKTNLRLLDEPLHSLDPALRPKLLQDLLKWHREQGGTTIHVTHDADEAMQVADRIAILSSGRVVQFATPSIIYDNPQHIDAATLLGSPTINLIPVPLKADASEANLDRVGINYSESLMRHGIPSSCEVIAGVRPQHWIIEANEKESPSTIEALSLKATVERIWRGSEHWHLSASCNGHLIQAKTSIDDHDQLEFIDSVQPHQTLYFSATAAYVFLFDKETGNRLGKQCIHQ